MILHIGKDIVVPLDDIVAILDIKAIEQSKTNKEFFETARKEGFVESISEDFPKSFVLTDTGEETIIYISPISTSTLLKRTNYIEGFLNSINDKQGGLFSAKPNR
ncbi:MAG TPA: extracellular matrix/biofilm biosynthesis regulator RemA family protein [Bacillota bacterium]|nr:extracellular matrix/biofilm biosynthesis regulator RemA family protein [Bacillota bacterium]